MRTLLVALCLGGVLAAQDGPPRDPNATRPADLVELDIAFSAIR